MTGALVLLEDIQAGQRSGNVGVEFGDGLERAVGAEQTPRVEEGDTGQLADHVAAAAAGVRTLPITWTPWPRK
jgi:hypothetical protein